MIGRSHRLSSRLNVKFKKMARIQWLFERLPSVGPKISQNWSASKIDPVTRQIWSQIRTPYDQVSSNFQDLTVKIFQERFHLDQNWDPEQLNNLRTYGSGQRCPMTVESGVD